jgi:hypothetical protein
MYLVISTALWLLLCTLVGIVGRRRKFGFWGYFFGSILLTPLIGLLLVLASDKRPLSSA